VVDALEALEFKYNVAMVLSAFRQGYTNSLLPAMYLLQEGQDAGIATRNYALRSFVEDAARLEVASVTKRSSFDISLSGIADALKTLVAVLDPTSRLRAKEEARHEAEMHRITEESARLDLYSKRWNIADAQFDRLLGSDKEFIFRFSAEFQAEIRRVYVQELARDILALDPDKITIIEFKDN
jgi:hypothetical protein